MNNMYNGACRARGAFPEMWAQENWLIQPLRPLEICDFLRTRGENLHFGSLGISYSIPQRRFWSSLQMRHLPVFIL